MDPDATLAELLDDARGVLARDDATGTEDAGHVELAQKVVALHDWIMGGGYLPAAWMAMRLPTPEQRDKGYRTDAGHEFEPMPGDDTCMYVLVSGERCMKYAGDHR